LTDIILQTENWTSFAKAKYFLHFVAIFTDEESWLHNNYSLQQLSASCLKNLSAN